MKTVKEIIKHLIAYKTIDQAEMVYVIQQYIKEKRGVEPVINIPTNSPFKLRTEMTLLNFAFESALEHFITKYEKE